MPSICDDHCWISAYHIVLNKLQMSIHHSPRTDNAVIWNYRTSQNRCVRPNPDVISNSNRRTLVALRVYRLLQVMILVICRVDYAKRADTSVVSDRNTPQRVNVNVTVESGTATDSKIFWREEDDGHWVIEYEISPSVCEFSLNLLLGSGACALVGPAP